MQKEVSDEFFNSVERAARGMAELLLVELDGRDATTGRAMCLAAIWDLARHLEEELPRGDCVPLQFAIGACFSSESLYQTTH